MQCLQVRLIKYKVVPWTKNRFTFVLRCYSSVYVANASFWQVSHLASKNFVKLHRPYIHMLLLWPLWVLALYGPSLICQWGHLFSALCFQGVLRFHRFQFECPFFSLIFDICMGSCNDLIYSTSMSYSLLEKPCISISSSLNWSPC